MKFLPLLILFFLGGCKQPTGKEQLSSPASANHIYSRIGDIEPPAGFTRAFAERGSFAEWLRNIPVRKDKTVYLYNGSRKKNQAAQFVVLDVPVGKRDLQQCADAVMRLRAEYLFDRKRYHEISFADNASKIYQWKGEGDRLQFERYLEGVFGWCGSASLEKQLRVKEEDDVIKPGDVFIKGGFPGHAMMVVDVAKNDKGERIFMLAQSYMPAQDIHIVINPMSRQMSPWYEWKEEAIMPTPEWTFYSSQLKSWP